MQASRMIRVAKDLLDDYTKFKVADFLQEAIGVASVRGADKNAYRTRSGALKVAAQQIIRGTILNKYPHDLKNIVALSEYAAATPERLATIVLNGFPNDPNLAISSSELQVFARIASALQSELAAITRAADKFNIAPISIPDGLFSLDILLPRESIDDEAEKFAKNLSLFVAAAVDFIELVTGKRDSPLLVYTSTSDPVTAIAMYGGAAYAFLKFYKLVLEVAEKQVSFLQLLKGIREAAPKSVEAVTLEESFRKVIAEEMPLVAEKAVNAALSRVPEGRTHELRTSLSLKTPAIANAVAKGARLSITIESLDRLELLLEGAPAVEGQEVTRDTLVQDISERSALETKLDADTKSLGADAKQLLFSSKTPDIDG